MNRLINQSAHLNQLINATERAEESLVPFVATIEPGESKFVVEIESTHVDKKFSFGRVTMVPDFFSEQAMALHLDVPEEEAVPENFTVFFQTQFYQDGDARLFPNRFETKGITTWQDYTKNCNDFFETNLPSCLKRIPLVFDWTDERYNPAVSKLTFDEYVRADARTLYGKAYDPALHWNALPVSVRDLPGVNNYLFPDMNVVANADSIHIRFHTAPNMTTFFSSKTVLKEMGFQDEQIQEARNQMVFVNRTRDEWISTTAILAPGSASFKHPTFSTGTRTTVPVLRSFPMDLSVKKIDTLKNISFVKHLNSALDRLAEECNVKFSAAYDAPTKKFKIIFPQADKNLNPVLLVSFNLAHRLGFGFVREIKEADQPEEMDDNPKDIEAEKLSIVLCNDTGMLVICDDNNLKGNLLTQAPDSSKAMAILFATDNGTMETPYNLLCSDLPTTAFSSRSGYLQTGKLPLKFRMYRFFEENQQMRPFIWNVGAKLNGYLRGFNKNAPTSQSL